MSIFPSSPEAVALANNITSLTSKALTNDVFVKKVHSHNDYWRDIPCLDSIMHGVQSIEADIWAFESEYSTTTTEVASTSNQTKSIQQTFYPGELYVGHDLHFLNDSWSLSSLYLDPIWEILESTNPEFSTDINAGDKPHGVFYGDVEATLYLFLDSKKNGNVTYNYIKPLLQRFIDKNYLTYYNNTAEKWELGPLTIVLTGNVPTEMVKAEETRYVTLDGHLKWFNESATNETLLEEAKYSVIASTSYGQLFGGGKSFKTRQFNDTEQAILSSTFNLVQKYGILSRIWDHVNWPVFIRDEQNKQILALGADFLNIDDLDITNNF